MSLTQITTGGVDENINIDSNTLKVDGTNNRVGIGTAAPGKLLSLQDSTTPSLALYTGSTIRAELKGTSALTSLLSYSNSPITFNIGGSAETEALRIDGSGRVGVGTSAPYNVLTGKSLSIGNGVGAAEVNFLSATNGYGSIYFGDGTSGNATYRGYLEYVHTDDSMRFGAAASERMRIDSSGNVMIGTTSAASYSQLTVRATSPQLSLYATPGQVSCLNMGDTDDNDIGQVCYSNSDNSMRFVTNAGERMRIDSSGSLGLGTDSPSTLLDVRGEISVAYNANYGIRFYNQARNNWSSIGNNIASGSSAANLVFKDSTGEVMRLAGGKLLVGSTATSNTGLLCVKGNASSSTGAGQLTLQKGTGVTGADQELGSYNLGEGSASTAKIRAFTGASWTGTSRPTHLTFETTASGSSGPSERMRIDSSGRVVIGHTSPLNDAQLTISDNDAPAIAFERSGSGKFESAIGMNADSALRFYVGANSDSIAGLNEAMKIDGNGRVLMAHDGSYYSSGLSLSVSASDNGTVQVMRNTNASLTNSLIFGYVSRTSNSAFQYIKLAANNAGDNDFILRGDGNAYADGSWNAGGADYAEYFEWSDGNLAAEDRRGISVILDGDKIREAVAGEEPIGVISGNPSVAGDADIDSWKGKYLRDDYGTYIQEDYEVEDDDGNTVVQQRRQLNPDYNPDTEYVSREDRPEWDCVGLMGKLRIRKGQVTGTRWIKMRDVSDTVEEWLVR